LLKSGRDSFRGVTIGSHVRSCGVRRWSGQGDARLAEVRDLGRTYDDPSGVALDRLTIAGHDFLAGARADQRWNPAMTMIKDKGCAVSVGVLAQILATLLKHHFGMSLTGPTS
jgi:hypothetical protein